MFSELTKFFNESKKNVDFLMQFAVERRNELNKNMSENHNEISNNISNMDKNMIERNSKNIDLLGNIQQEIEGNYNILSEIKSGLQSKVEDLRDKNAELNKRNGLIEEKNRSIEQNLASKEEILVKCKKELEEINNRYTSLDTELRGLRQERTELENDKTRMEDKFQNKSDELSHFQNTFIQNYANLMNIIMGCEILQKFRADIGFKDEKESLENYLQLIKVSGNEEKFVDMIWNYMKAHKNQSRLPISESEKIFYRAVNELNKDKYFVFLDTETEIFVKDLMQDIDNNRKMAKYSDVYVPGTNTLKKAIVKAEA